MGSITTYPEYLYEVVELTVNISGELQKGISKGNWGFFWKRFVNSPMDITDNGDWSADMDDVRFAHEHFFGLFAYFSNQSFVEDLFL